MSWWESGRNYVFIIGYEQLIWSWIALAANYMRWVTKKKEPKTKIEFLRMGFKISKWIRNRSY